MPPIDFNNPNMEPVTSRLDAPEVPADWTDRRLPFFNYAEEIAGVVDANNKLHLVSTVWSLRDTTTGAFWTYTNTAGDGQVYRNKHTNNPDEAPIHIYDFTETNSGWEVVVVDSMRSEYPGTSSTNGIYSLGYAANPWAVYEGSKQSSNARIQLSRTPDGKFIVYTWAESNTQITDAGQRWNTKPDIHVRMRDISESKVLNEEFDITGLAEEVNVQAAAFMHNTSPICKVTGTDTHFNLKLPIKVSNSPTLKPEEVSNHYYATAELAFPRGDVGVKENDMILDAITSLYPNPAQDKATLSIEMKKSANVSVSVMNVVGQVLSSSTTNAVAGQNEINVDVNGLATGIYMVNIKVDGATSTKKLIVK
jgi:hypothetical protein